MEINIKGVQKTSLIDYPGKVCSVIFVSRCNFRCPFCHNSELVFDEVEKDIPPHEIFDFLDKKKDWIDGVCITGGEPTLHKGLPDFIREIKKRGFLVKLDTNGTNPSMVAALLKESLLDYVAMDIKAPLGKYDASCGVKANKKLIQDSIDILMRSGIGYEFRTTVVPGLFEDGDAKSIGEWLKGAKKFCIQQFRNADKVLDPKFQNTGHYHIDKLEAFKTELSKYIKEVEIRGV
jgi:pyruvate formate lyase activating enzyme